MRKRRWLALSLLAFCVSGAAQEVPRLHTVDPPVFHSSVSSDSRVSEIGYLLGARFLDPDRIVFLDTTIPRLVFVTISDGEVESAGREGDGPGEFRMPFLIGRHEDAAVVWDRIHRRLTLVNGDGRSEQATLQDQPLLTFWSARVVGRFPDGTVVTSHPPEGAANPAAPGRSWALGRHRDLVRFRALVPGEFPHMIVELLGNEMYSEQDGNQKGLTRVIFGDLLLSAPVGELLAVSQTDLGVVNVLDLSGVTVAEIPLPPGIRMSRDGIRAEQERARERRTANTEAYARMGFPGLDLEFRDFPANEIAPPIDRMRGDLDGRLWLRALSPGADREHWQVWDVSGPTLEFTLTLPIGEELLDAAGSRVLLRARDELDVDYLIVREMVGG